MQFKKGRYGIVPGDMRPATNAASAEKMADVMAPHHIGVAAYAVTVDEESGSMANPRLPVSYGQIFRLDARLIYRRGGTRLFMTGAVLRL